MSILAKAIDHFEENGQPLWIHENKACTAEEVRRFAQRLPPVYPRVAVHIGHPLLLVKALVSLPGRVDKVILITKGTPWEQVIEFLRRSDTDLLITDGDDDHEPLPGGIEICNLDRLDASGSALETGRRDTKIIIPTSGTTGVPKLVSHTLASLTRTTRADPGKGVKYRWGLLYDVLRFAGLQVFLQSLLGGSTLILTGNDDPLDARLDQLVESGCNAVSATPTMWRKILMLPRSDALPMKQITLGGEIADDMILKALHGKYPRARITHIYASTEAGVGFAVNDMKAGFPVDFLEHPPNDVQIRVDDEGFMHLKKHEHSDDRYVGTEESLVDEEGFINTGDLVRREGDRFLFLGRANGAINVGGNKVMPEEVELVLLQHPEVEFAKVGSVKSSMMGELVTATVKAREPVEDQGAFKIELLSFCSERLEPFKVPSMLSFTDEVELNASGKMNRSEG